MTLAAKSRLIILTAASGVLLIFLHLLGVLKDPEAWAMRSLAPQEARLTVAATSLRRLIAAPFKISAIMDENEALKRERDGLLVQIADLKGKADENDHLHELLKFSQASGGKLLVAHVLASTPEAGIHTILIDRGSDDGLRVDMPVVTDNGIVVGKIFKSDRATALALLLTDTRSRVGAMVHDAAKTQGIVQGKRGLSLEMQLIPQNEALSDGDLVVTSGIEPLIPSGLLIGRIQGIQTQERDPFKTATVQSPISYDGIETVAIPMP